MEEEGWEMEMEKGTVDGGEEGEGSGVCYAVPLSMEVAKSLRSNHESSTTVSLLCRKVEEMTWR